MSVSQSEEASAKQRWRGPAHQDNISGGAAVGAPKVLRQA